MDGFCARRVERKSGVLQKRITGLCLIVLAQARASTHDFLFSYYRRLITADNLLKANNNFTAINVIRFVMDVIYQFHAKNNAANTLST